MEEKVGGEEPDVRRQFAAFRRKAEDALKAAQQQAMDLGIGMIAQEAIVGYLSKWFELVRPDQLHGVIHSGVMIADLLDKQSASNLTDTSIRFVSLFLPKEKIIEAIEILITPDTVAEMVRTARPEIHEQIVTTPGGGYKWYFDQCTALKEKIIRIVQERC